MKTKVKLRNENKIVDVIIADKNKPNIEDIVRERWQKMISLIADILNVPAGLIMQITETHMQVFLKSQNDDNPYAEEGKDTLLHGLYCETVIGKDQPLHIKNSLDLDKWKDNPDVALNMVSYYGLPIKWGDGSVFGTLCVLDKKSNEFEEKYRQLMSQFRDMIEQDLLRLEEEKYMLIHSNYDFLTGVFNRRKFNEVLNHHFLKYKETKKKFSLIIIDIDSFKYINDYYGHVEGDRVLKRFAQLFNDHILSDDIFCRYGGDEFGLISTLSETSNIIDYMHRLQDIISSDAYLSKFNLLFSYGDKIIEDSVSSIEDLIRQADKKLFIFKENKINNL